MSIDISAKSTSPLGDGLARFESPHIDDLVQFTQAITWKEFNAIRKFAFEHAGISIADYKQNMVFGRVVKRLRALAISTIAEYLDYLEGPRGSDEYEFLINALTTNKTSFFREDHHFTHLANSFFPEIVRSGAGRKSNRIRIWSAGCSSGEEPYSIAMTALSSLPAAAGLQIDLKILATDIDTSIVHKAKKGIYSRQFLDDIPEQYRRLYLRTDKGSEDSFSIRDFVRDKITFKPLNLICDWPMKGPFDAIFCRNVVIYFNKETQKALFDRFAEILPMGGLLYIGHSESLHRVTERFEIVGQSIYRKVI